MLAVPPVLTVSRPGPVNCDPLNVTSSEDRSPVTVPPEALRCGTLPPAPVSVPNVWSRMPAPVTVPALTVRLPPYWWRVPAVML